MNIKKYVAEFIGTAVLVIFGCGSAVAANTLLGGDLGVTTPLAFSTLLIAFAFGLSIVAMAYSIGNVSGCHINPAVSVGVFCAGKMSVTDFIGYLVAQFLGGIAGAGILTVFFGSNEALGQNGYGEASALGTEMAGAFLVEVVLTFVFVLLILGVTSKEKYGSIAGVVIGLTLVLIHILGIPFTGTSVNPARSFGPALLVGGEALKQVWLFIVAPVVGGILAALVYRFLLASEADA
ncbi:aquaporin Z [Lachnospiraceae bacterium PF1-21]|uniref:MIP family channel protein n=1 Tax=Ohessyouella blattaphilus TaxID=2949333 RepID=UPI002916FD02|nr:MIP family channel protein [Ohessyouella blattaphilus]